MKRFIMAVTVCITSMLQFVSSGCMSEKSDPISGAQYFVLTPSQINENRALAKSGDKDAAFLLYQHFALGVFDKEKGDYWLRKAADLGHKLAKQHLAVEEKVKKRIEGESDGGSRVENPFN